MLMISAIASSVDEIIIPILTTPSRSASTSAHMEVPTSNISSAPGPTPCGSDQIVKRRRGRPRKTPLVSDTTRPATQPVLPPFELVSTAMQFGATFTNLASATGVLPIPAYVENFTSGPGPMPYASAQITSRRYKRSRQRQLHLVLLLSYYL